MTTHGRRNDHTRYRVTGWKKSLLIRATATHRPVLVKLIGTLLRPDHKKDISNNTSLVSTSGRSGIMKRMQRLGIQLSSAPGLTTGLAPDKATSRVRAHLCYSFLHYSAALNSRCPEAMIKNHEDATSSSFKSTSTERRRNAVVIMKTLQGILAGPSWCKRRRQCSHHR